MNEADSQMLFLVEHFSERRSNKYMNRKESTIKGLFSVYKKNLTHIKKDYE